MKILFILPAPSLYTNQGRVMGWRHTPSSHDSLRMLKVLAPRIRELGAERVIASDLDEQSARAISRTAGIPCELWQSLRRFNWGKHHGWSRERAAKLLTELEQKWSTNPDIPIHGGDSRSSFTKRMGSVRERLASAKGTVVVVADAREIEGIIGAPGPLEPGRVYECSLG